MAHTPTAGQQTRLATLQANVISTAATEAAAYTTYHAAKIAAKQAAKDLEDHRLYIQGNTSKPGTLSSGKDDDQ